MATFEDLFSATSLDIIAPEASVEYPPSQASTDDWLSRLQGREQAFLGMHIEFSSLGIQLLHCTASCQMNSYALLLPFALTTFLQQASTNLQRTY